MSEASPRVDEEGDLGSIVVSAKDERAPEEVAAEAGVELVEVTPASLPGSPPDLEGDEGVAPPLLSVRIIEPEEYEAENEFDNKPVSKCSSIGTRVERAVFEAGSWWGSLVAR
jgi:hypothetical protein